MAKLEDGRLKLEGTQCLVTGGLGFIGSNLAHTLAHRGASVKVVDNLEPGLGGAAVNLVSETAEFEVTKADIGDRDSVAEAIEAADLIFNLAGQTGHSDSMKNPQRDLALNVTSQLKFLSICASVRTDAPIVFASTRQIYGRPDSLPVNEKHPLRPVDINGIHKVAAESYHRLLGEVEKLNTSVIRLTNTYGPRMRVCDAKQTFIGVWIRDLIQGKPLQVYGSGEQIRDFTYVDDAVEAIISMALADNSSHTVYNLGGVRPYSLNQVAETLTKQKPGARFENVSFPADREAIDIGDFYADYSHIGADLGWSPKVDLAEGFGTTLAFYERHRKSYGI